MIDVKHSHLCLDLIEGAFAEIENPLGTSFDLADVYVSSSPEKLLSSRFYHSWNEQDETAFADKMGVWVMPTSQMVAFQVSSGGRDAFPARFHTIAGADIGDAMFFLLPTDLEGRRNLPIKITLVCMN